MSVTRLIPADRQALFDIVADPARHPVIDGSGRCGRRGERWPGPAEPGRHVRDGHAAGADYRIRNTVVEFDEPAADRLAALQRPHLALPLHRSARGHWSAARTMVTEEWDARGARNRLG